jgi:hypothetical protein
MARRRESEAERLRRANAEMKLALAENCTVLEARRRIAIRRREAFEAELARRDRCGRAATPMPVDQALATSSATQAALADLPAREPRFWWERD